MILDRFMRVNRQHPCTECGKPDWCLWSGTDPNAPDCVICPRTPSDVQCGDAGYLHDFHSKMRRRSRQRIRQVRDRSPLPELEETALKCTRSMSRSQTNHLADALQVSAHSLHRLRTGWNGRCWTFPMVRPDGTVCGIRLRRTDGRKFAVRGSQEGLFIPVDLAQDNRLLIAEGPSDVGALLDLGFRVIGRPSCTGGTKLAIEYLKQTRPSESVIFADADGPGRNGADRLASALTPYCPTVRIVQPPDGHGDAREWVSAGATHADVSNLIHEGLVRRLSVRIRRRRSR